MTSSKPPPAPETPGTVSLRTLLQTDLVGSALWQEEVGYALVSEIWAQHDRTSRELLAQHGGLEIDKANGFLLLFERPIDAVRYALAYHRALSDLSQRLDLAIGARAGIHTGEVILRESPAGDFSRAAQTPQLEGPAKATAGRLTAAAAVHQTLMSRGAYDLARTAVVGKSHLGGRPVRWLAHGAYRFEGLAEPVEIFEVGEVGLARLEPPPPTEAARSIDSTEAVSQPAGGQEPALQPVNIFVSYSHKDSRYLDDDALLGFMKGLENEGVEFWTDRALAAGDAWDEELRARIGAADIAMVLVSQAFLDSRYCTDVEISGFLERSRKQGLTIFPVILSACEWERHEWLRSRQFLPREGKTIEEDYHDPGERKRFYLEIRRELRQRIAEVRGKALTDYFQVAKVAQAQLEQPRRPSRKGGPPRARLKTWGTAAVIAVAATAAIGLAVQRARMPPPELRSERASAVEARPSLAVLGFENLSGQPEKAWIATAIAEALTTELGIGDELRTVGGRQVAEVKRELAIGDVIELDAHDLERLRQNLNVDLLVYGSYSSLAADAGSLLRLDVRLQDAASGQVLASEGATGTEQQLFDLLLRAGATLRQKLGAGELSPAQALAVQASLPTNSLAARLYAEGLDKLRQLDAQAARELLEKAIEADPEHPLPYAEMAAAWSALGYDAKASEAAQRAAELADKLPRNERRLIEARYFEIAKDWPKAITGYASLFESFPDDVHLGLRLAEAQNAGGQPRQALVTVEALRRLPSPASADPRIDLVEAESHYDLGDREKARAVARKAAGKGEAAAADLLVARARIQEARADKLMGDYDQAMTGFEEGRRLFEAGGDRRGAAQALDLMAITVYAQGDLAGSRRLLERTLEIYREIGARADAARVLTTLGSVLLDQGKLSDAETLQREALDTFLELGAKYEAAAALTDLGYRFTLRGELQAAAEKYRQALGLFSELGQRSAVAITLTNIAEVQFLLGNLDQARQMHEESLAINREIGDKSGVAYDTFRLGRVSTARGDLFVARSRFEDALGVQDQLGESGAAADTRLALAHLELLEGDAAAAEKLARQSEQVARAEGATDLGILAQALLAGALLAQDMLPEAREVVDLAAAAAGSSEDRRVRLATAIAAARVRAAGLVAAEVAAALDSLEAADADAGAAGYVEYAFEARLAIAEIEAATGRDAAAGDRLEQLAREAKEKGYGDIAQRATAAGRS